MTETRIYLDIHIGDQDDYAKLKKQYDATYDLLQKSATIYGLPLFPSELSQEQSVMLAELDKSVVITCDPPAPLLAGRLVCELSSSRGLSKTTNNFTALCTGEKGACKNAPNKSLHFKNVAVHRIVKDFIAQGGDVTRGDGSGGESIYGGKFNDDKEGLKTKFARGTLAMANAGKNSNSSQFFVCLTDDPARLAKLDGKYVVFGRVVDGMDVLDRLNEVASADGKPTSPVWIGDCGKL